MMQVTCWLRRATVPRHAVYSANHRVCGGGYLPSRRDSEVSTSSCGIFDRTFAVYSSLVSFFIPLVVMLVADARSIQSLRRNFCFRFYNRVAVHAFCPLPAKRRTKNVRYEDDRKRSEDHDCSSYHLERNFRFRWESTELFSLRRRFSLSWWKLEKSRKSGMKRRQYQ